MFSATNKSLSWPVLRQLLAVDDPDGAVGQQRVVGSDAGAALGRCEEPLDLVPAPQILEQVTEKCEALSLLIR